MAEVYVPLEIEDRILLLPDTDYNEVTKTLQFLADYPLGAQKAGIRGAKDIRRAVAGNHLLFYRYYPEEDFVLVLIFQHARQKPPKAKDFIVE